MIVAITDGRANISLKRSTDPEATTADTPRPSSQELKVNFITLTLQNSKLIDSNSGSLNRYPHLVDNTPCVQFIIIGKERGEKKINVPRLVILS